MMQRVACDFVTGLEDAPHLSRIMIRMRARNCRGTHYREAGADVVGSQKVQ